MTRKQLKQQELLSTAHHDYQKGLNNYAFFKVHDRSVSEDLVQDTFMKTWKYFVRGGKIDMMKAFLYHVLNDLIVDEYRKRKNVSFDVMVENNREPINLDPENISEVLDGKSALLLIQQLPEKYREVMRMRFVKTLSLKEISLITGQSKNTIAVQIHRGIEKLKTLYKPAQ